MQAFLRGTVSIIIGGVCGTLCFAPLMYITEWLHLPEAKKPLAVIDAYIGGIAGFILGVGIGLVVVLTNADTTTAMLIGAGFGTTVVVGISLYISSKLYIKGELANLLSVPRIYIFRYVMIVVIATAIASIMPSVIRWLAPR